MNGSEFQEIYRALHELSKRVQAIENALGEVDISIPPIKDDEDE
jgi:hypothetical protein